MRRRARALSAACLSAIVAGLGLVAAPTPARAADAYATPVNGKLIVGDLQLFTSASITAAPPRVSCVYNYFAGILLGKSCRVNVTAKLLVLDAKTGNHVTPDRLASITGRVVSDVEDYAGPQPGPTTDWKAIESFTNTLSKDGSKEEVGALMGYDPATAAIADGDIQAIEVLFHHFTRSSEMSSSDQSLAARQIRYVEYDVNGVKVLRDYVDDVWLANDPYTTPPPADTGDSGTTPPTGVVELGGDGASVTVGNPAWTGKKITDLTVTVGGQTLKKGTDYTIAISGDTTKIGLVTVTVTGLGKYSGTVEGTVIVRPAKVTGVKAVAGKAKVAVKWKKAKAAEKVTGYQVRYRAKGATAWSAKTVKASKAALVIKKLKKAKKYQVQVRAYKAIKSGASKGTYYSVWSATKTSGKVK
jgi:hypothetical protein